MCFPIPANTKRHKWTSRWHRCYKMLPFNQSTISLIRSRSSPQKLYINIGKFQPFKIILMNHLVRALLNFANLSLLDFSKQLLIIGVMSSFFWRTSCEEICAQESSVQNLINFLRQNSRKFFARKLKIAPSMKQVLEFFPVVWFSIPTPIIHTIL